jgi:hypothetical protein
MLEIFFIIVLIFLVLTFFYKQAICEFRLNQIEWGQHEKIANLLSEKVPIILRGRPPTAFWTQEDTIIRNVYSEIPIFQDRSLSDWLMTASPKEQCPWSVSHARLLGSGSVSGLDTWAQRIMNPIIQSNPFLKILLKSVCSCWAGERGLFKTTAVWTAIFCTQSSVSVTILTESAESALPSNWRNTFPSRLTAYDTPFVGDLKYMDIILRPGNILFMPTHWFVSWETMEDEEVCPMLCMIEYHSPISRFADWIEENKELKSTTNITNITTNTNTNTT